MPIIGLSQNHKISGVVKNDKSQLLEFVNVVVQNQADSLQVFVDLTNKNGAFEINNVPSGDYILKASIVGYKNYSQKIKIIGNLSKQIVLKESAEELSEVVVSNKKPIIKRKSDRIEFNVQNTIVSSNNAWEILKRTPGVLISGNTISIRGSRSVLVTINDKKTYLSGEDLKNLLQGMGGTEIKLVEVITNPSAKYDATGSSVLNLKLINNTALGYKGSIGTIYSQGIYAENAIFSRHFYKTKTLALMAGYRFDKENELFKGENVVSFDNTQTTWKTDVFRRNDKSAIHNFQMSAGITIDSLNTITVGANIFNAPNNSADNTNPTNIYNNQNQLQAYILTNNKQYFPRKNNSYYLNYDHQFKKGMITLAADYVNSSNIINEDILATNSVSSLLDNHFINNNNQDIKIFSSQADYILENEASVFEIGIKNSSVKANNVLDFQNLIGTVNSSSNNFDYTESVLAGYISYSKELKKWSLKAGLRTESTVSKGVASNPSVENENKYINLFPTANALYKISEGNSVGFTYGKRIQRPNYKSLNPSKNYSNPFSYFVGDVNMKPMISDNFGISFTRNDKYFFDLYYKNEKNPSLQISKQDNGTKEIYYKDTNIEKNEAFGLDFSTELNPKAWWTVSLQSGLGHNNNIFIGADNNLYKNSLIVYNASVNQVFYINEAKGFTAEMNFKYNSPTARGSFTIKQTSNLEIGFRKKMLQNKAELAFKVSDIFRGDIEAGTSQYANQNNYFHEYVDTQRFLIDFRYRFGNQKISPSKEKEKTEEQKRIE